MNMRLFARAVHVALKLTVTALVVMGLISLTGSIWFTLGALLAMFASEWWALGVMDEPVAYYRVAWPAANAREELERAAELTPDSMMSD